MKNRRNLMPKISIIIPVYNAEKYLSKCLDSLLSQTLKNIEIICVNDGSQDDSYQIMQNYARGDKRIKIFTQNNSGPAEARNVGLKNAHGKYLMFCDSDDFYNQDMCQCMLDAIEKNNADFVMCDCNLVIENGNTYNRTEASLNYHHLKYSGRYNLVNPLKADINVLLWNKIFRMDIIHKYNIKFPKGLESDDNAFVYQYLAVSSSFFGLPQKLYNYRILENSVMGKIYTQKQTKHLFDYIDVFVFTLEFFKKHNIFANNKWLLKIFQNNIVHVSQFFSENEKKMYLQQLKEKVLSYFNEEEIRDYPLLYNCTQGNLSNIIQFAYANQESGLKVKKYFWGLLKKVKNTNKKEYYICGLKILKKKFDTNKCKYYVLGIKIYEKKIQNCLSNNTDTALILKDAQGKVSYLKRFIENDLQGKTSYLKRFIESELQDLKRQNLYLLYALYNKDISFKDKYIICFDCLYDKDAEAIDAYTFFQYLQQNNIKSKYMLLKSNQLAQELTNKKDIILLNNQDEFFDYIELIAQSSTVVTSFGGWGKFNFTIKNIPFINYVFIDHGVIWLKRWVCDMYCNKYFDYILAPSKKTYELYINKGLWNDQQIIKSGLPRWDKLKKEQNKSKNIFIFFTWRKTFEKQPYLSEKYFNKICSFLFNSKLEELINKNNIIVNIAFHHALTFNKIRLPQVPNYINVVNSNDISKYISRTDLLITDYSSICFDFMYLNIPVIFYLFDCQEMFLNNEDQKSLIDCISVEKDLYNFCFNETEVISLIENYINDGFKLETSKEDKNKNIFYEIQDNCKELYEQLFKISKK